MNGNESSKLADDRIVEVEKSTREVLTSVFESLKNNVGVKADGPTRLFFPNGIELISVIVKVNVKDGIDVEVKIAGEKGIKGTVLVEGASFKETILSPASPQISSIDPGEVQIGWEGTVKIFGSGFDNDSFALFNGLVPKTSYSSDTLLKVDVTKEITGTAGAKVVKVHTGGGSVSNDVSFLVKMVKR